MQAKPFLISIAALMMASATTLALAGDDSQEPPLAYTLTIDGKAHALTQDAPTQLPGTFRDPTVVLTAASTRRFAYGGVAFEYPASFNWEAEIEGPQTKTWTLSGNDFNILYLVLPQKISSEDYAQAMAEQLGAKDSRITPSSRQLGDSRVNGNKLAVTIADTLQTIEIYILPLKPRGARVLMLQDTPPSRNGQSQEATDALALLARSFSDTSNRD